MNEAHAELAPDEGLVRLFPLPDLVLFPHVFQPLHIFEPRYRQMMADSLADDRQFAMALLRPNWEEDYDKRPAIYPTICLGRIHDEERLHDSRFNLFLEGVRRGRIVEEVPCDRLYRVARVRWLDDIPIGPIDGVELARRVEGVLLPWAECHNAAEAMARLLQEGLPLEVLTDVLAFALPMPVTVKVRLLDEPCSATRLRRLLTCLEEQIAAVTPRPPRRYPPAFSDN